MKFIALFFSFYMILLALMPCQDLIEAAPATKFQTSIQKAHQCNEQGNLEACSPFCTCACCSIVTVLETPMVLQLYVVHIFEPYAVQHAPALKQQSISIWQPPRLS